MMSKKHTECDYSLERLRILLIVPIIATAKPAHSDNEFSNKVSVGFFTVAVVALVSITPASRPFVIDSEDDVCCC